uniref:Flavoprotein domain-containing protein n=1 Tax=Bionectria ochroleuca TaxID=29856 RepID=A0A0B7KK26_BIOOC
MAIVLCSMKALAAIRAGSYNDLMSSALDVTLKGSRRLLLTVPEILLNDIDLDNMLFPRAGAVIFPPDPAFYTRPRDTDDFIYPSGSVVKTGQLVRSKYLSEFGVHKG